jgi:ubiquinone/menaquinone biosynthesis C-methylase UbiE
MNLLDRMQKKNHKINKVIDVGCGMGNFTLELAHRECISSVVGMDLIKDTFSIATENYHLFSDVTFIEGDIRKIPFKNRSFDVTFCLNVLHHIHANDFSKTLHELCRITSKYLLIEFRNKNNIFDFWYDYFLTPNLYQNLPINCCTFKDINNIIKTRDFRCKNLICDKFIPWISRRIVLIYQREKISY